MATILKETLSNPFSWMYFFWILIQISLMFVSKGPINNIPVLILIKIWRHPGDKPLSEPMMVSLPWQYIYIYMSLSLNELTKFRGNSFWLLKPSKHSGIDRYPFRYCSTVVSGTGSVSLYKVQGTDMIPFDTRLAHRSGTRTGTVYQYRIPVLPVQTCCVTVLKTVSNGIAFVPGQYCFCTGPVSLLYWVSIAFVLGQYRFCTGSMLFLYTITVLFTYCSHWNVIILMKFSSLVALKVVKVTTFSATSDENAIKMTTFPFQCCTSLHKLMSCMHTWHLSL